MTDRSNLALAMDKVTADLTTGFGSTDRALSVGASEIGDCARKIAARKQRIEPDKEYVEKEADNNGFATRGNVMEDNWQVPVMQEWARLNGGELLYASQEEQISLGPFKRATATPDGIFIGLKKDALHEFRMASNPKQKCKLLLKKGDVVQLELKSIDPRVDKGSLPQQKHVDQLNQATGLTRRSIFEVVDPETGEVEETTYKPKYGILWYADASNYRDSIGFVVIYNDKGFKSQLKRIDYMMDTPWEKVLPEGSMVKNKKPCTTCEFAMQCLGFVPWVPKTERSLKDKELLKLDEMVTHLEGLKEAKDEVSAEITQAEADIKVFLSSKKTSFAQAVDFKASWTTRSGQSRFQGSLARKYLENKGVDIEPFMQTTKPSEVLKVERVS